MALPSKNRKGLRFLEHEGTRYCWKVENDHANMMLKVLVGMEAKPFLRFKIYIPFLDTSLYFPWLALAHEQGRDVSNINELEHICPKFITEAIGFADTQNWQEKKHFMLEYKNGSFLVQDNSLKE